MISIKEALYISQNERTLFAPDFRRLGFYEVDYSYPEYDIEWSRLHKECKLKFGERYTWTGTNFWFETPEDAFYFKVKWFWGIESFLIDFPFAIRMLDRSPIFYSEVYYDMILDIARQLKNQFGVDVDRNSIYQYRWIGLKTERDAMYARLLLPENEFVKAEGIIL